MKFIFIYFLYFLTIFSSDTYIAKNKYEENILKKYRNQELILGLCNSNFKNEIYNKTSFNLLIEKFLKNYLKLNIKVVKKNWETILIEYQKGDIDIVGGLTPTIELKKYSSFSNSLYPQELYLASNNKHLSHLKNTNNKELYIFKDFSYGKSIKKYIETNHINATLNTVNFNKIYNKDYYIGVNQELINFKHRKKIGNLPDSALVLQKKYADLLPIINNALNEKYHKEIIDFLKIRKTSINKNKFLNSLTIEEKNYLKTLKPLKIPLRKRPKLHYFSKIPDKSTGSLILTLKEITKITGIKFNIIETKESFNNISNELENRDINLFPLYKSTKKLKDFLFTKQIDELTFYKISSYDFKNNIIGILDKSLYNKLIKDYYLNENIRIYKNIKSLKNALDNNIVSSIFLLSYADLDSSDYKIEKIEKIPIYLALPKDSVMLKNILNKAIKNLINRDEIRAKAKYLNSYDQYLKDKSKEKTNLFIGILIVILLILLTYILRILYINKKIKRTQIDPLTGLNNRISFNDFQIKNKNKLGYLILIEIDKFYETNDKYGHYIGDRIIVKMSKILSKIFFKEFIFRISGDEFLIFLEDSNIKGYLNFLKSELDKYLIATEYKISLNISYYKKNNRNLLIEDAFKYTNMGMIEIKNSHTLKIIEVTEELIKNKNRENLIKSYLIDQKISGLYPVYQPKFDIQNNKIVGAETLARWSTSDISFISPAEFIPISEEINLVHLIDYKMAEESIKIIKKWKNECLISDNFKISFNISMQTFERDDIIETLKNLIAKYNILGEWIEIEITESILSSDLNDTLKKLDDIKKLNIQMSIDDFTAGHSTASLLPYLPASIVKFDKSILDIITKENIYNHSIYKNLINLAKDLNLKIVAEGIETEYQLNFLKENKVDIGQGFLFSRPISQIDFEKLLKNENGTY